MFSRFTASSIARVARRPSVRAFASFVRSRAHAFIRLVVRAFASFAHRGDRLRVLHRPRARPRRPARRPFPDRDLLPILMRHRRRRRRRRALTRRAVRSARAIEWVDRWPVLSIDDPSIDPFDRSTVRRSRSRSRDRSRRPSRRVRVFSRCRAVVRPRRDRAAATRARAHTAAR